MTELAGRTALVTGAAQGIGAAIVDTLVSAGAGIIAVDARDIADRGPAVQSIRCDVSDADAVSRLYGEVAGTGRQIDFAINAAGILSETPIIDMDVAEFDRTVAVNLRGTFLIAQGAARMMQANGGGRLILFASELAYLGRANFSAYCASKAGVVGMTRALARELAPDILVNCIAPGPIDTPMLSLENMSPEWLEKEIDIPLRRIGTPQEIAGLVRFLCGPDAGFFTGQTISPNGGAVML